MPSVCRCGHGGVGDHPCHARGYSCRRPAQHRIYAPYLACLAGAQFKLGAYDTWACDECWGEFTKGHPERSNMLGGV